MLNNVHTFSNEANMLVYMYIWSLYKGIYCIYAFLQCARQPTFSKRHLRTLTSELVFLCPPPPPPMMLCGAHTWKSFLHSAIMWARPCVAARFSFRSFWSGFPRLCFLCITLFRRNGAPVRAGFPPTQWERATRRNSGIQGAQKHRKHLRTGPDGTQECLCVCLCVCVYVCVECVCATGLWLADGCFLHLLKVINMHCYASLLLVLEDHISSLLGRWFDLIFAPSP